MSKLFLGKSSCFAKIVGFFGSLSKAPLKQKGMSDCHLRSMAPAVVNLPTQYSIKCTPDGSASCSRTQAGTVRMCSVFGMTDMKVHYLRKEQIIHRNLSDVFAFFEKPENLSRITPPGMGFEILTPTPIKMRAGAIIDYTVKAFGLRTHWRTLIADYDPPNMFVDIQLKGPYTFWHHTHSFERVDSGTLIRDEVRYCLPFGVLGGMVHSLFVKRELERIFDYRSSVIENIFAEG